MATKHPQLMFEAKLYKYINPDGKIEGYPQVSFILFQDICSRLRGRLQSDDNGSPWQEPRGFFRS